MRHVGALLLTVIVTSACSHYRDRGTGLPTEEGLTMAREDLLCVGNDVEASQPDRTEAPVQNVAFKYTSSQIEHLSEELYWPLYSTNPARRTLQKAMCEYWLHRSELNWTRSVGEAVDAHVCDTSLDQSILYSHPALVVAVTDLLFAEHPQKAEVRDETLLRVAASRGDRLHCRDDVRYDHDPVFRYLYRCEPSRPASCSMRKVPPERWSARALMDAVYLLNQMSAGSQFASQREALLKQLTPLLETRRVARAETIAQKRTQNPSLIPQAEIEFLHNEKGPLWHGNYLWHELCGKPKSEKRQRDGVIYKSKVACVRVTTEAYNGCYATDANFRLRDGEQKYEYVSTESWKQIDCP
jgi:hypothetical protein